MKQLLTWGAGLALLGASLASAAPPPAGDTAKPPAAGDAPSAVSDDQFVKLASAAGLAEVNFGTLAAQQAMSPDVKAFAQHMVADHTMANTQLNSVADKAGIAPASRMDAMHQELFTRLSGLRGADFDRQYVESQVADHKVAVALFEAESKNGKNEELEALAAKTLPTLQHHLEMAQKLAGEEKPAADKNPATDKVPATDKHPAADKNPATDKKPAADKNPATDKRHDADKNPATDKAPDKDKKPDTDKKTLKDKENADK